MTEVSYQTGTRFITSTLLTWINILVCKYDSTTDQY